ncbi:MAG: hypothetical protein WC760_06345 [Bacteroidia bacterium]|jgi:hypothetical protein
MNNIKTIEDVYAALGTIAEKEFPPQLLELLTPDEIAYREVKLITKALNQADGQPWEPDWNNHDQWKYYPWFRIKADAEHPSGVGLSYYVCADGASYSAVGSRLCFKSSELAEYAATQFVGHFEKFFFIRD